MIKNNRTSLIVAALLVMGVMACQDFDDTPVSVITSFEKFSFSELPPTTEVPESDHTYTVTFGFDDRQIMDVAVDISVSPTSTATEGEDFDLSTHQVSVGALGKTGSFDITIHADQDAEGPETIVLHLAGHDAHGLPTPVDAHIFTIRDSIYPVGVQLDWEGTFEYAGGTYTLCDNADIDLYLLDDEGNFAGGFGGATAACPETMYLTDFEDGVYSIAANLYNNGLFGAPGIDTIPIPMCVTLFKGGVLPASASDIGYCTDDYPSVPVWTAYTPSDPNGEFVEVVGTIRVSEGQVVLVDPDGDDVGSLNE